jgi:hypothetical protein
MSLGRSVGGRSIKAPKIRRRSVVSIAKVRKMAKKEFPSIDLLRVAPDLFGYSLYKGQKKFFHNADLLGIKRRRILCRIQKYKLFLVKVAPTKSY